MFEELNGAAFSDLNDIQQEIIKDYAISVHTIAHQSNPEFVFEVFERLNMGSTQLNEQELRNCIYQVNPTRTPSCRVVQGSVLRARVWKAATSKADPRRQQDCVLKCLRAGRAHPLAACAVATRYCSTRVAGNEGLGRVARSRSCSTARYSATYHHAACSAAYLTAARLVPPHRCCALEYLTLHPSKVLRTPGGTLAAHRGVCFFPQGPYTSLLGELASDPFLLQINRTSQPHIRMRDREQILRFFAMMRSTPYQFYSPVKNWCGPP